MTATNKLRVATIDTAHAIDIACSVVLSAVGLLCEPSSKRLRAAASSSNFNSATSRFTLRTPLDWPALSRRLPLIWKSSALGRNRPPPNRLLNTAPTSWGWATNPCLKLHSVPSTTTFQRPIGIALTPHGTLLCPPSAPAKRLSECHIGADTATDSRRTTLPRSGVDSRDSPNSPRLPTGALGVETPNRIRSLAAYTRVPPFTGSV
jgi:hypothetical protein